MSAPLLEVVDLHAYYGKSHILHGVNFRVEQGEIVSLLGRNGVGRSTTIKAIMGAVPPMGSIRFKGEEIAGLKPHETARRGLGYVPETRDIFPALTVRQNLLLGEKPGKVCGRWAMQDMFRMFPQLEARAETPGGVLSGGEQQMLTICRTLMGDPELVMIDEPTEGLSPKMVERVGALLAEIAERGVAILLVEQKLAIAAENQREALCDGTRKDRLRGDAGGARGIGGGAERVVGGVKPLAELGMRTALRRPRSASAATSYLFLGAARAPSSAAFRASSDASFFLRPVISLTMARSSVFDLTLVRYSWPSSAAM